MSGDQPQQVNPERLGDLDHDVHADEPASVAALDSRDVAPAAADHLFQLELGEPAPFPRHSDASGDHTGHVRFSDRLVALSLPRFQVRANWVRFESSSHLETLRTDT